MPDKGQNEGFSSGAGMAAAAEADAALNGAQETDALNRNDLMQLTGKQLAKKAAPYSTLQLNSLERKSKAWLCDLILSKGQSEEKIEEQPFARAARTESQTETFINIFLSTLDHVKQTRDHEPLNPVAKQIFQKQAIVYTDEKIKNEEININKANNVLLYGVGAFILFDGLIGIKNSPALAMKIKNFFSKRKKEQKSDDTK